MKQAPGQYTSQIRAAILMRDEVSREPLPEHDLIHHEIESTPTGQVLNYTMKGKNISHPVANHAVNFFFADGTAKQCYHPPMSKTLKWKPITPKSLMMSFNMAAGIN